ncbi:MAG: hypothetical protein MPL62_13830 [Alphaproteobacteria bacterium]|nr:hypothetical protein [Alphaproteobacteria bacterium]
MTATPTTTARAIWKAFCGWGLSGGFRGRRGIRREIAVLLCNFCVIISASPARFCFPPGECQNYS